MLSRLELGAAKNPVTKKTNTKILLYARITVCIEQTVHYKAGEDQYQNCIKIQKAY